MVEPKLTFFKMQIKSRFRQTSELGQPHFSDAPEVFNSVNMGLAVCKFVIAMLNPIMLFITQVNEAIIAFLSIGVDCALKSPPFPGSPLVVWLWSN